MAQLKIYSWERETYKEFREIKIGHDDAKMYLKKFSRHFKVREPLLHHCPKRVGGGIYFERSETIKLENLPSFGTLIHEFAHHLTKMKYGIGYHHGKNFKRSLKRVYTFAKRYIK